MSRTLGKVGIIAIIPIATLGFCFPLISKSSKESKRAAVEFTSAPTAKSSPNYSETTTLTLLETLVTPTPPEATSLSIPSPTPGTSRFHEENSEVTTKTVL
ncbi:MULTISPECIES: hypothetical protein [unclassified Coleofasciculus]|uniref:hypothetical protein n=1 Tax=unclassified Coleofasciculus TaxID=2692782 RepID=UPI00187DDF84|nr:MULTISPECIES: hypothetical protein [unclassified Coleofasciculus]MBE9127530.1 hypothetical protein [Coleofasciculus sp. LEGE 07081]MBE9150885.1 hypothetical protein [Coleofasciculus sp. LEGE 07092]